MSNIDKKGKISLKNHFNSFYTGNLSVGYLEKQYNMIFDTGSSIIFVNSVKCNDIGCVKGN